MKIIKNPQVEQKFRDYPDVAQRQMNHLRNLILETAKEMEEVNEIEETLKWGEPSYLTPKGSTIRIDWKPKNPDQYAMYFNCQTSLIPTFKIVFSSLFKYEKNRAILFNLNEDIPDKELKECIKLALKYHEVKDKPLLGK